MAFAYDTNSNGKCVVQCRDLVAINEPDSYLMCAVCVNGVNGRFAYNFAISSLVCLAHCVSVYVCFTATSVLCVLKSRFG